MPRTFGLLWIPEVARLLRVKPCTVENIMNRGDLPFVRIGRRRAVRLGDLEDYLTPKLSAVALTA